MNEIGSGSKFISSIPFTESAEGTVAERLVFVACCMECILISEIEFAFLKDFIIRKSVKLLKNKSAYDNIDRSIGTRVAFFAV